MPTMSAKQFDFLNTKLLHDVTLNRNTSCPTTELLSLHHAKQSATFTAIRSSLHAVDVSRNLHTP